MMKFARFAAAFVLAASVASVALADPFTVKDLVVDKTAASVNQAMTEGRAEARLEAARRLIDRLTLAEDRATATQPIDPAAVARMFRSYDNQAEERRTSTRYMTVMSVNFMPEEVRQYLDQRGVAFVERQAGLGMVTPVASGNLDPVAWARAWEGKADNTVLTPFVVSQEAWDRPPQWESVQAEATRLGALRAIVAGIYLQNGQMFVRLSEVRGGYPESLLAIAGPFSTFEQAQAGSVAALERAWKTASVVRTTGSTPMALVARFGDIGQWVKIRQGVQSSRLIRGLKIESISSTGADLSFVYSGRPDQLSADLRSRGLSLRSGDQGWVIEAASFQ